MSMQQRLKQSGYWAATQITQALQRQERELIPTDITFLFSVLLCLSSDSDFESFPIMENGVTVDIDTKAMTLIFQSDSDVDRLIKRFLREVFTLGFGPSGWTLNILKAGSSFTIQTVELPDWEIF
ncbi:MAG: hypothetical protein HC800_10435 [Phormidesmis sp. RL_2_1]|nr:hypothetical protein [Phormidesmis sp. RL_2_1]